MSQPFILVYRKNPLRPQDGSKYYAQAKSEKTVDVHSICKRIGERSSYSVGELEGAIGEFLIEIEHVLEEGSIAQMGRLGNFRLTLKSLSGTNTMKEFTSANIKKSTVRFHAGPQLKEMCSRMKYRLYKAEKEEATTEETNP